MKKFAKPAIIAVVICAALALVLALTKYSFHGRIAPGASIGGQGISFLKPESVSARLSLEASATLSQPIKLKLNDREFDTTLSALGVNILVEDSVNGIRTFNANTDGFLSLFTPIGSNYKPIVSIDREKLDAALEQAFGLSAIAPKSATFRLEGKGKLVIDEGSPGTLIDKTQLISALKTYAQNLSPANYELKLSESGPLVTASALESQKADILSALDFEFTLVDPVYSDNWDLSLSDHLEWVDFKPEQSHQLEYLGKTFSTPPIEGSTGQTKIAIEIKQEELNKFIDEKISKWLDRPPTNVKIYRNEKQEVIIEGKGSNGLEVQRRQLKAAIELAVANRIKSVPIPVIETEPSYDISRDLRDLGITERLTVGHTSYYGSPANRVHNIKVGASRFNGRLIAPDEVFSFNQNLGRVDATTGYKKELVIKPEGTIPEYGGGICQVSTTLYRAILLAGLPVVERNQHSYAVSYYSQIMGHGLDATIYLGGADLKFRNDTGHHILVQAYTDPDYELYFVLYGTPTGRTVTLEGPYLSNYRNPPATVYEESGELLDGETKQVEKPHKGFDALWYRHLTTADGSTTTEKIETRYRAMPSKILVGTGQPE